MKEKGSILLLILIGFLLSVVAGAYIYSQSQSLPTIKLSKDLPKNNQNINNQTQTNPNPSITPSITVDNFRPSGDNPSLFNGQVSLLDKDLNLFSSNISGGYYYEAGTYTEGSYKGYKRIVALSKDETPFGPSAYIFTTSDYNSFILNYDPELFTSFGPQFYLNPFSNDLNKNKVNKIVLLPTLHPLVIKLNSAFSLYQDQVVTGNKQTNKKDQYNNLIFQYFPQTDFSSYQQLPSNITGLKLYVNKISNPQQGKYLSSDTEVIAADSTGLAYSYHLVTTENVNSYNQKRNAYLQNTKNEFPYVPHLSLLKGDIKSEADLYETYDTAFPHGCGVNTTTYTVNPSIESDLTKIGTSEGADIFVLKDKSHPLYKKAYENKTYNFSPEEYKTNLGDTQPTYDEYVAKYPLIFFKDYWNRWVVLGEYHYHLLGGCAKPVLYLYPPQPTQVNVKFAAPMNLDITIPQYSEGWKVLANPNGTLIDLQSQLTDCKKINYERKGSEYAKQACSDHTYPYLYWAGQSLIGHYPSIDEGWVVERNELSNFLNFKLGEIGLNEKEKNDMLEYWLPEILNKNTPYYKISFLQTQQMNNLAPLSIMPKPDVLFRIFLDYVPLNSWPNQTIQPQILNKITRKGFTVVEWGGLKR